MTVFENGELLKDYTFQEVQERAALSPSDFDIEEYLRNSFMK